MSDRRDNMQGPVILVTGAGHGFGRAVAKGLGAHDVQLVLTSKSRAALEVVDDEVGGAVLVPMDFKKSDEIERLAGGLLQRFERLDALISCHVEMADLTPVAHIDPKVFQSMLNINLIANFRLIRALDPLLRMGSKPAAAFLTCEAGRREKRAFWSGLAASKAALEAMVQAYAAESEQAGIQVFLHDPGPLPTRSRARAYPGERQEDLPNITEAAASFIDLLLQDRRDWRRA